MKYWDSSTPFLRLSLNITVLIIAISYEEICSTKCPRESFTFCCFEGHLEWSLCVYRGNHLEVNLDLNPGSVNETLGMLHSLSVLQFPYVERLNDVLFKSMLSSVFLGDEWTVFVKLSIFFLSLVHVWQGERLSAECCQSALQPLRHRGGAVMSVWGNPEEQGRRQGRVMHPGHWRAGWQGLRCQEDQCLGNALMNLPRSQSGPQAAPCFFFFFFKIYILW